MSKKVLVGISIIAMISTMLLGCSSTSSTNTQSTSPAPEATQASKEEPTQAPATAAPEKSAAGKIVVSSKNNTPNLIKGWLMCELFEANGFEVVNQLDLGGTNIVREALLSGQIDVYMEYTGTAWSVFMQKEESNPDAQALYKSVADWDLTTNNIVWYQPAPENDTYTTIMRKDVADSLGIKTMSDLAKAINDGVKSPVGDKWSFASGPEYAARPDGAPGLQEFYGFKFDEVKTMSPGIYYTACRDKEVPVSLGMRVDGRIAAFGLVNLEDDKGYNPIYNACMTVRKEVADKYPQIAELASKLTPLITEEASLELNRLVDVDGKDPKVVAHDFLVQSGLITQ